MNYKAEYKPSELLCPVTSTWVDLEAAKNVLDQKSPDRNCCALVEVPHSAEDESSIAERKLSCIDKMVLDIGMPSNDPQEVIKVEMLNGQGREIVDPVVKEFIDEVGEDLCDRFVIKLS